MDNVSVAAILFDIANMLELKGDNPFRIKSYQRAARTIENLPQEVTRMAKSGTLRTIPGVGESIAQKITELADTGHIQYYDELCEEFPEGLRALLSIQGLGPRTVAMLSKELGITNATELEAALSDGRVAALPRMGPQVVEKLLAHVKSSIETKGKRIPLGFALNIADDIVTSLMQNEPGIRIVIPTGSLRRMRDTIGDLDFICVASDSEAAINAFLALPQVHEVLVRGEQKVSTITSSGLQMDFRIVPKEHLGSHLQYSTGSKGYNIALRERAVRRNIKVSEYGITDPEGVLEMFETEEEFYRALGIQFVSPELREVGPIIEAAEHYKVPELVRDIDVLGDAHVHSDWSDGHASLDALHNLGSNMRYRFIVVTDHTQSLGIAHGLSPERLLAQIKEIRRINDMYALYSDFRLFAGTEVDIKRDGTLDMPDEILEQLDVVIASVHSGMNQDEETMTQRIISAMRNPHVDVIGHPTCRLIDERDPVSLNMEAIFQAAKETNTALEINGDPARLDLKDTYAHRARDLGVKLSLGTDAHYTHQLRNMRLAVATARRGWCTKDDILNCRRT